MGAVDFGGCSLIVKNAVLFLTTAIIAASSYLCGCAGTARIQPYTAEALNLMNKFVPADPDMPDPNFKRSLFATRKGVRRSSLMLIAPASIQASLKGASGKMTLRGWAAPVFNIGDGFQMGLFLIGRGKPRCLWERYFDPGRKAEDRNWIPIVVPCELTEGDQLVITVSGGPQEDLTADWLALSSLRLVKGDIAQ
jgi:hypothetical protein